MTQLWRAIVVLSVGVATASPRDFVPFFGQREQRSLVNTFPFNNVDSQLPERETRQGLDNSVSSIPFSAVASSYAGGKRCIDKVSMEEVTEYDTVIQCDHSYNRRCAKSLKTTYEAQQEEECEENYVKKCFIQYGKTAQNVTVNVCRTPLVKDCDIDGEEICSTQYESECLTEQEIHEVTDDVVSCQTIVEEKCEDDTSGYTTSTKCSSWPREECSVSKQQTTKYTPLTKCNKVPVELCGPAGCGFVEGVEQCYEKTQTVIGDKPEETCSLDPQRTCKHVTKLVPKLVEVENCFDVPKEVCVRSQTNPRKVKKPVVKKWCYVVKCEDECTEAAARGECLPQCETYRGDDKCCAPCPSSCLADAAARNQCKPECQRYSDNPKCCFDCPKKCRDDARAGTSNESCRRYNNIPGCFVEPVVVEIETCQDYNPECFEAAQSGQCSNECYSLYGRDSSERQDDCCGTCPDLCKDYAREREMTYKNGTLDCMDFDDEACFFQCPARCQQAYRNGETDDTCSKYTYLNDCYRPCPTICETAYMAGETEPECEKYSDREKCYLPCPTKCTQAFENQVEDPSCEQYSNVPSCYYTPCEASCQASAGRKDECSGICLKYKGNANCCYNKPTCPSQCTKAYRDKVTLEECRQYETVYENCFYEPCPQSCQDSVKRGETNEACREYLGDTQCYINGDCPDECQQKSLWGECPAQCKEYMGNPDCCAPTCPPKCTNKRRGSCEATGTEECGGIPGCCPEHFDQVFGAGVYLPPPEGN